jgi:hypothetical protein
MISAIEQLEAAQPWTAQLKSVQETAAKFTEDNSGIASRSAAAAVADARSIQGYLPDPITTITGSIPDAAWMEGIVGQVTPIGSGTVPVWQQEMGKLQGHFPRVTSGLSFDDVQRAGSALAALSSVQDFPPSAATSLAGATRVVGTLTDVGQVPIVPRRREGMAVVPQSLLYRESVEPQPVEPRPAKRKPRAPRALPQELGEAIARNLTRGYRQEAKGLLVALDLGLELEHLEAIERRLLDGGRPDRLHAALSASLLLEGVANRFYPPRTDRKSWTCRFKNSHELGAPDVKSRLHAFAHPFLEQRSTAEHKLFVAELDLVARWMGKGHHVVFTKSENEEAFIALLKVLATVAHARRHNA